MLVFGRMTHISTRRTDETRSIGSRLAHLMLVGRAAVPIERFGGKAASLVRLVRGGARVPRAYAVSSEFVSAVVDGGNEQLALQLKNAYEDLLSQPAAASVIVRSSHCQEDGSDFKLSGYFRSVGGVDNFAALLGALNSVATSGRRKTNGFLPVVLQAEIDCDYSALIFSDRDFARVELFSGPLAGPANGTRQPTVLLVGSHASGIKRGPDSLRVEHDGSGLGKRAIELGREALAALDSFRHRECLFEMGRSTDGTWYAFQVQDLRRAGFTSLVPPAAAGPDFPLAGSAALGSKAAAMCFFHERGLFRKRLRVLAPGDMSDVGDVLSSWPGPYTIRFSKGFGVGLPRMFTHSADEANRAINDRPGDWSAIVHEFIPVTRSFEALIEEDSIHLEHLPGIWESDADVPPDGLVLRDTGSCVAYASVHTRHIRLGTSPEPRMAIAEPISEAIFHDWATRISDVAKRLRTELKSLPVNVHFVEDDGGAWHFLNIRPGYALARSSARGRQWFRVSRVDDLRRWDGLRPILLSMRTSRGEEGRLASLARALRLVSAPIYSEFGLLSHPALVLQAHGIRLMPAYFDRSVSEHGYRKFAFRTDTGHDPIVRILREARIFENEDVIAVEDREPIVPGHLLVVAKHSVSAFSDLAMPEEALRAAMGCDWAGFLREGEDALFYERGRASFCTSGFTAQHAHLHLLPSGSFESGAMERLASLINATRFASPAQAWSNARDHLGEYLLFGSTPGPVFLARPATTLHEKRFIRTFLCGQIRGRS